MCSHLLNTIRHFLFLSRRNQRNITDVVNGINNDNNSDTITNNNAEAPFGSEDEFVELTNLTSRDGSNSHQPTDGNPGTSHQ